MLEAAGAPRRSCGTLVKRNKNSVCGCKLLALRRQLERIIDSAAADDYLTLARPPEGSATP